VVAKAWLVGQLAGGALSIRLGLLVSGFASPWVQLVMVHSQLATGSAHLPVQSLPLPSRRLESFGGHQVKDGCSPTGAHKLGPEKQNN